MATYLLHMATSFLKGSNFSSHRVKFARGMTEEMQQIIYKSRIVLDLLDKVFGGP